MPSKKQHRSVGAISLFVIDRFLFVPTIIWPIGVGHPVNTLEIRSVQRNAIGNMGLTSNLVERQWLFLLCRIHELLHCLKVEIPLVFVVCPHVPKLNAGWRVVYASHPSAPYRWCPWMVE